MSTGYVQLIQLFYFVFQEIPFMKFLENLPLNYHWRISYSLSCYLQYFITENRIPNRIVEFETVPQDYFE